MKGAITKGSNIILSENQFLQWTSSGKRLELWEGKQEYLQEEDIDCNIRRLKYWNENYIWIY